jgi:N-acetylglucosaminyldiphosphoundecaprenol N-acetyl-beta-D-mannosaminyltransferase
MIIFKKYFQQGLDNIAADFAQTRKYSWDELEYFASNLSPEAKVLDLGCGNGRLVPLFKQKKINYNGLDISPKLIEIAQKNNPEAEFIQGAMQQLPFKSESFDQVWSIASFHHLINLKDRQDTLREIHRVLKEDGLLQITLWNLDQDKFAAQRQKAFWRSLLLPWWDSRDLVIPFGPKKIPRFYHGFTFESFIELLRDNYFEVIDQFAAKKGEKVEPANAYNLCLTARKLAKKIIVNLPFSLITKKAAKEKLQKLALSPTSSLVVTPNPEMCLGAEKNQQFKAAISRAEMQVADGSGIIWAEKTKAKNSLSGFLSLIRFLFSSKQKGVLEVIPGTELFRDFCLRSKQKIFFLGGAPGVALRAAQLLAKENPELNLADTDAGSSQSFDDERIVEKIKASGAEVLFVAFGAPAQELWLDRNLAKLPQIKLAMGIGGSFDHLAGTQKRAPKLVQKLALEWLWRVILEPRRIGRIYNATVRFVRLVIKKRQSEKTT